MSCENERDHARKRVATRATGSSRHVMEVVFALAEVWRTEQHMQGGGYLWLALVKADAVEARDHLIRGYAA